MRIPEFSPLFGKDEVIGVLQTLEDNWLTEGKKTKQLEAALAEYFGCKHVVMVPNGTLAIFAALKVLGIGPGDEVIVPDLTFFGSASAIVLTGAKPVFADIGLHDFNIDPSAVEACLSERTKAILPVHLYGQSCDLPAVIALAKRHNLFVVEDAAQAMGATFGDRHVGTFGDIGCMSFFADKTMTTGEGGALLIDDDDLADRCMYFKNQGRLKRGSFLHEHMGYNFRITDMQAAIGLAQFSRLDEIIEKKRRLRMTYRDRLADCSGLRLPIDTGVGEVVPFRVNILVSDPEGLSSFLAASDIGTRRFFYPLHRQPSFDEQNSVVPCAPVNSVRAFETGLMLPSGLDLTETQIDRVCACIHNYQLSIANGADSSSLSVATSDTSAVLAR